MSNQITTAFSKQYGNNVQLLSQQKTSRLRNAVRIETITGEEAFFEQIGATAATKVTERHGDTPLVNTPHSRRRVATEDYDWADLIDNPDRLRMLIDPTSAYVRNAAAAFGRAMDEEIIRAIDGIAYTGKTGTTQTPYDTNNTVGVQVGGSSSDVGLNVAKVREAKYILDNGDVDPMIPRYMVVNAKQLQNMLAEEKATSIDYNTVRALVRGEIDEFLGFKFIMTNLIGTDSNNDHKVLFWAQDGILLGTGEEPRVRISERDDKRYSTQVYMSMSIGATRMEEKKAGVILCDPS
jgi:hypothetical protein